MTREQIGNIIERTEHSTKASVYYDWFMVGVIIVSILPLMFMQTYTVFKVSEIIACLMIYLWQGGKQKGDNQNGNYCTEWHERCSHRFIALFEG